MSDKANKIFDVLNGCTATWHVHSTAKCGLCEFNIQASTNVYANVHVILYKTAQWCSEMPLRLDWSPVKVGNLYLRGSISSPIGNCTKYVVAPFNKIHLQIRCRFLVWNVVQVSQSLIPIQHRKPLTILLNFNDSQHQVSPILKSSFDNFKHMPETGPNQIGNIHFE